MNLLYTIQNSSPPCPIELPLHSPSYQVNLNTREIEMPDNVVVQKDHNSTVFYFIVDRFFDYVDLSTVGCVILYNVNDQSYVYPVPYYDIYTLSSYNKMILPWILSDVVTQQEGEVEFSIKFYSAVGDMEDSEIVYSLNTKASKFLVYKGLDAPVLRQEELENLEGYSVLYDLIQQVRDLRNENKYQWKIYPKEVTNS